MSIFFTNLANLLEKFDNTKNERFLLSLKTALDDALVFVILETWIVMNFPIECVRRWLPIGGWTALLNRIENRVVNEDVLLLKIYEFLT